jgi:hypothetical protein
MRELFRVPDMDSLDIWQIAQRQRDRSVGPASVRVDLMGYLEASQEIWTPSGARRFRLEIPPNGELPAESCRPTYDGTEVVLMVPRYVRDRAFVGDGEARFLIARGLGHATLHLDALLERSGQPRPLFERVVGGCSSAWQAGLFCDRVPRRRRGVETFLSGCNFGPGRHRSDSS